MFNAINEEGPSSDLDEGPLSIQVMPLAGGLRFQCSDDAVALGADRGVDPLEAVDGLFGIPASLQGGQLSHHRRIPGRGEGHWQTHRRSVVFVTHDIEEAVTLADRVVVLSQRPGRIRLDLPITLPRPRDGRALRGTPDFGALCSQVWAALDLPGG